MKAAHYLTVYWQQPHRRRIGTAEVAKRRGFDFYALRHSALVLLVGLLSDRVLLSIRH